MPMRWSCWARCCTKPTAMKKPGGAGKAVKLEPDNPEALNFYGVALKSVGRLDEAREYILKALKLNNAMYGAYANLNDLIDFSKDVGDELFNRMDAIFEASPNLRPNICCRCISPTPRRWKIAESMQRRLIITSPADG